MSSGNSPATATCASAGNHAQGVAYAASAFQIPATIVMPTTTPLVKVNNTKDYGGNVILHGEVFDDAAELAAKLDAAREDMAKQIAAKEAKLQAELG